MVVPNSKNNLQTLDSTKKRENEEVKLVKYNMTGMVGPPGFEPESRESKSQSLDQASRRPLHSADQRIHQIFQSSRYDEHEFPIKL